MKINFIFLNKNIYFLLHRLTHLSILYKKVLRYESRKIITSKDI